MNKLLFPILSLFFILKAENSLGQESCSDESQVCRFLAPHCGGMSLNPRVSSQCKKTCGACRSSLSLRDLRWSSWASWSECGATCGRGIQTRHRTCHDVTQCDGESIEERPCLSSITCPCSCSDIHGCADNIPTVCALLATSTSCGQSPVVKQNCQKSCGFCNACSCGTWSTWETTECSQSCGPGIKLRQRTCPQGRTCDGVTEITLTCNKGKCTLWGTWSPWSDWESCSASCNVGTQKRRRSCLGLCPGSLFDVKECKVADCPEVSGQWSPCSKTCSWGTRTRQKCNSCNLEYEDCKVEDCPTENCVAPFYPRFRTRTHSCCNATSFLATSCGINSITEGRIIGGSSSLQRAWPWMVQIHIGTTHICGGSLISNRIVITAAHCFRGKNYKTASLLFGASSFQDSSDHVQTRIIGKQNVYIHSGQNLKNDIAIIKFQLSERVDTGGFSVRPICLPQGEDLIQDLHCVAAGWGKTSSNSNSASATLQDVVVRILPFEVCMRAFPFDATSSTHMVCAGKLSGGVDTCSGDSGGPLMCQRCSSCSWFLAGITSFGSSKCGAAGAPGVYTRIAGYENWINSIVGHNISFGSYPSCL